MLLLSSQARALSLILLDLRRNKTSSTFLQCSQRKAPARALVYPPRLRRFERGPCPCAAHPERTLGIRDDITPPPPVTSTSLKVDC